MADAFTTVKTHPLKLIMTRSSKPRRAKARAKKRIAKQNAANPNHNALSDVSSIQLSEVDKRYLVAFGVLSIAITAFYWWLGGRNLFVFPTLFCLFVGARRFWTGPVRRYADSA
jgi:hypothetical protein